MRRGVRSAARFAGSVAFRIPKPRVPLRSTRGYIPAPALRAPQTPHYRAAELEIESPITDNLIFEKP